MDKPTITPQALAVFYTAAFIKGRIERIRCNMRNPAPALAADKARRKAARREAAAVINLYRAALRLQRSR